MDTTQPLYTVAQIRQIEADFEAEYPNAMPLMQRAGNVIGAHIESLLQRNFLREECLKTPEIRASSGIKAGVEIARSTAADPKILVLVGSGNNGGDGILAALALQQRDVHCVIAFTTPTRVVKHPLAKLALDIFVSNGGVVITVNAAQKAITQNSYLIIVDAIFGIGMDIKQPVRPIDSGIYGLVEALNLRRQQLRLPVIIALDVPSGLNAETGLPWLRNADSTSDATPPIALIADQTLTFISNKVGLNTGDGADYAGDVFCFDLDIPQTLLPVAKHELLKHVDKPFAHRSNAKSNVHKGTFGTAVVLGGALGMEGAGWLAARAALLCGAGKTVFMQASLAPNSAASAVDFNYPEIIHTYVNNALETPYFRASSAVAIGPGLGQSEAAAHILEQVLQLETPVIVDADALTLVANSPALRALCVARRSLTVFTPHPLEAAGLLHSCTPDVQANRVAAAQQIAKTYNAITVLKGAGSITADVHGHVWINKSGNVGMASGGMGDVLSGMLSAAFCGVNAPKFSAGDITSHDHSATNGATKIVAQTVWLHGHAADCCVAEGIGPVGLRATEVAEQVRKIINKCQAKSTAQTSPPPL